MVVTVTLFFALSFLTYTLFSVFGHLTGGSPGDFWQDILEVFKPLPLLLLVIGNVFFAAALSIGFKFTSHAIPSAIAIGVIASFIYSAVFLGGTVTWIKGVGILLILAGIYFLR